MDAQACGNARTASTDSVRPDSRAARASAVTRTSLYER